MDSRRSRYWLLMTRALLLAVLVMFGCSQPASEPEPVTAPDIAPPKSNDTIVPVRRGDLVETIVIPAQLVSTNETALFFRQSGRLKNLLVSSNDQVKAGQLLAEMEVGDLDTKVALAEIAMKQAQVKLEQARTMGADRFTILLSQIDFDRERLTYEQLRQQLTAARLVAPFDGLITETQGQPGETINAFTPVVTIADPSELQIMAQVSDVAFASHLAIGQPATLVLDKFPNERLSLEVVQLPTTATTLLNGTPVPSDISRQFKLNPVQPLPKGVEIGMLGRVTVVLREKQGVLMVKSSAVRSAGPRRFVQVVQGGRKRDVDVEVGIVTATDTEILVGLREGDQVVDGPPAPVPVGTPARRGA